MSDISQLEDNTGYMQEFSPLTEGKQELAAKITDILNRTIRVLCTSCRHCMEECPIQVNIPNYFGLLNLYAVTGKKTNMYYQRYSMNHARASECLKCGRCERICPQHIVIRQLMDEFAALYEG